uniref:serine hydrolase domain-containing protein n=1 Tax=Ningiella ruwaisensis TaxID=2364274 RepID=UPI0010A02399|nr:serine hydrolase domain-containing protein [Ningiella ruwaisensis]
MHNRKLSNLGKSFLLFLFVLIILLVSKASFALSPNTSELRSLIAEKLPENEPGCSVGVFEKGEILLQQGFGLANAELNVPMSANNVHRMASVSKQFVAMAVLLLADEGKINLFDDIRKYVKDLPDYQFPVTINSIIGHTAGMGDYDLISTYGIENDDDKPSNSLNLKAVSGHPFRIGNEDYLSVAEFHDIVKTLPLTHQPDTKWQYSNMGYVLLAILIEEVTGKTLREFSHEKIFTPLGMKDTFFADDPNELVTNRAYGYIKNSDGEYENNMTNLFWVGDGGLHTTIADMYIWDSQFYSPVLGKEPHSLMQSFMQKNTELPVPNERDQKIFYANGQFITNSEYGQRVYHSGGWLGAMILYERYPEHEFSSIIMCSNVSADRSINTIIKNWFFED